MNLSKKYMCGSVAGLLAMTATLFSGCLGGNDSETVITDYSNALITGVTLTSNTKVCADLSSYGFTIDHLGTSDTALIERCRSLWQYDEYTLKPGIIFNPDSLPAGSVADSIKLTLSYTSPYSVYFYQYDEDLKLCNVTNYSDTQIIWFDDYAVTRIEVTARDRMTRKSYFMKMNVHQCASDTIMWNYLATGLFDMANVIDQRVDTIGRTLFWYTMTADSAIEVRTADLTGDITAWSAAQSVATPSAIDLGTLLNWRGQLYAIGQNQTLLSTGDGVTWTVASAAHKFVNLLGIQLASRRGDEHLCAIALANDTCRFLRSADGTSWQFDTLNIDGIATDALPARFPIKDYTRPISVAANPTGGSTSPRIYINGGLMADGTLTSSTWTSDGSSWVEFRQTALPAARRSTVVRYQLDIDEPGTFWIMQTGEMAGGYVSDTLYYSQNSGVMWKKLQREHYRYGDTYRIAPFGCSSGFVNPQNYRIYFIGGKNPDGRHESNIVSGQLIDLAMRQKR